MGCPIPGSVQTLPAQPRAPPRLVDTVTGVLRELPAGWCFVPLARLRQPRLLPRGVRNTPPCRCARPAGTPQLYRHPEPCAGPQRDTQGEERVMHSGCRGEGAGVCFSPVLAPPSTEGPVPCSGRGWGCNAPVRTGEPGGFWCKCCKCCSHPLPALCSRSGLGVAAARLSRLYPLPWPLPRGCGVCSVWALFTVFRDYIAAFAVRVFLPWMLKRVPLSFSKDGKKGQACFAHFLRFPEFLYHDLLHWRCAVWILMVQIKAERCTKNCTGDSQK